MGRSLGAPLNTIFSWLIKKRIHQIDLFIKFPLDVQHELLLDLVHKAAPTYFGQKYRFNHITSHRQFVQSVPLQTYEDFVPYIERLMQGEQELLWPTPIHWFAKSSGTTSQRSKLLPVSKESLEECHYKGGKDLLALYYHNHPTTRLFSGKHLIVGGSSQINPLSADSYFGDLSAIIVNNLPWWCEWRRTPSKEITLMEQWEEKIERMARETVKEDVMILAGVPSWTMVLIRKILQNEKTDNLLDIWPNLELYMHGGVSFSPYKHQFENVIRGKQMNYVQTYNASEGFFGIQDTVVGDDMLLMLDYGIYYEFIPMSEFKGTDSSTLALSEVEIGINYAVVISTNAGLWRYILGDTVVFTSTSPFRIRVTGRTTEFINAFGEELIVDNVEKAIEKACLTTSCSIKNYTVAPRFLADSGGYHHWAIEFITAPQDLTIFVEALDKALCEVNSDYEAKRKTDLNLRMPKVTVVSIGTFENWLKKRQKLGGQHKIPRLKNDTVVLDEILD
jgi:predicted phosphohydrolase